MCSIYNKPLHDTLPRAGTAEALAIGGKLYQHFVTSGDTKCFPDPQTILLQKERNSTLSSPLTLEGIYY